MVRTLAWLALLAFWVPALPAAGDARQDDKGTYLGILFRTRHESTPRQAPAARGVVITHVLPGSPADRVELRRNDVLIGYDRQPIRDGDHLAELIRTDRPNRKVQLQLLRANRIESVEVTLALGPALRLSGGRRTSDLAEASRMARAGSVSVRALPVDEGKMKLTIEYTEDGKVQVLTCANASAELAATLQKLPQRERQLVRIALERLRTLNSSKTEPTTRR